MSQAANDNDVPITRGSGNVFYDLGFDAEEADRASKALKEFREKGGVSFEDFKRELAAGQQA